MPVELVNVSSLQVGDEMVVDQERSVARIVGIGPGVDATTASIRLASIDPYSNLPERVVPVEITSELPKLVLSTIDGPWQTTIYVSEVTLGQAVKSFKNSRPAWVVGITERFEEAEYTLLMRDAETGSYATIDFAASDPVSTP